MKVAEAAQQMDTIRGEFLRIIIYGGVTKTSLGVHHTGQTWDILMYKMMSHIL